uniref:Uncharacterized protein n=1 Tax=Rousettus aegyptiacus TaxID=9407 RepID=A0A7J8HSF4_ROUAE|nr:hypothetical protein HJG63_011040 [Rousettus aegyptiacus]
MAGAASLYRSTAEAHSTLKEPPVGGHGRLFSKSNHSYTSGLTCVFIERRPFCQELESKSHVSESRLACDYLSEENVAEVMLRDLRGYVMKGEVASARHALSLALPLSRHSLPEPTHHAARKLRSHEEATCRRYS